MSEQGVTSWWWVRHAPVIDLGGIIYGQRDVPCDTSGKEAFAALAKALPVGALWVTSHLSRAKDTAAAISAQGLDMKEHIVEEDLAEQCLGDWQGRTWDDFDIETDAAHRAFWENPARNAPPNGESFVDVFERVSAVVRRLNGEHAGRDIISVAHGGTIRAAVALALDLTPERALAIKTSNLSLTRLDFFFAQGKHVAHGVRAGREGTWRVAGVNMTQGQL